MITDQSPLAQSKVAGRRLFWD